MNVLAAVHIADALANELPGTADRVNASLDEEYLSQLGLLEQVPEWRRIAASCMGTSRPAQWADSSGSQAA